jgi:hypothetical protein
MRNTLPPNIFHQPIASKTTDQRLPKGFTNQAVSCPDDNLTLDLQLKRAESKNSLRLNRASLDSLSMTIKAQALKS